MLSLLFPFVAVPSYLSSLALPLNRIDDAVGPSAKVSTRKMPKIDTLDALEEHEEHEDDYQTNSN